MDATTAAAAAAVAAAVACYCIQPGPDLLDENTTSVPVVGQNIVVGSSSESQPRTASFFAWRSSCTHRLARGLGEAAVGDGREQTGEAG